jgi:hypothetical protein
VPIQDAVGEALARAVTAAADARHERIGFLGVEQDGEPLLRTLTRLRNDLVMIGRAAVEPLPETLQARQAPALAVISDTVADHLRRSGDALGSRRSPPLSRMPCGQPEGERCQALAMVRTKRRRSPSLSAMTRLLSCRDSDGRARQTTDRRRAAVINRRDPAVLECPFGNLVLAGEPNARLRLRVG